MLRIFLHEVGSCQPCFDRMLRIFLREVEEGLVDVVIVSVVVVVVVVFLYVKSFLNALLLQVSCHVDITVLHHEWVRPSCC